MEHLLKIILASAAALLTIGMGLDWAWREFTRKRDDRRMSQALRRGLALPDGDQPGGREVAQWHSCDTTSLRCF